MGIFNTKSIMVLSAASVILVAAYTSSDNVSFLSLDTDNSGFISVNEAKRNTVLYSTFDQADLNKDKLISAVEFNYTMIR